MKMNSFSCTKLHRTVRSEVFCSEKRQKFYEMEVKMRPFLKHKGSLLSSAKCFLQKQMKPI